MYRHWCKILQSFMQMLAWNSAWIAILFILHSFKLNSSTNRRCGQKFRGLGPNYVNITHLSAQETKLFSLIFVSFSYFDSFQFDVMNYLFIILFSIFSCGKFVIVIQINSNVHSSYRRRIRSSSRYSSCLYCLLPIMVISLDSQHDNCINLQPNLVAKCYNLGVRSSWGVSWSADREGSHISKTDLLWFVSILIN